jgi:hypothetical protein
MVRANLILTGVSSARPNANGTFGAAVEVCAGALFEAVDTVWVCCWERAEAERTRQKTAAVAMLTTLFIVFSLVRV